MIDPFNPSSSFELQGLVDAIAQAQGDDAVVANFPLQHWQTLSPYLQRCTLVQGQVLFAEGSQDRSVYFVESGTLSVHMEDKIGRLRLAMVGPGSVVGEGAFFSHLPRNATVQAASACTLWGLPPVRFAELSHRQPVLALSVVLAAAGVLAKRVANKRRRVAAT